MRCNRRALAHYVLYGDHMRATSWLIVAGGFLIWNATACSGETETSANSASSETSSGSGGSADSGTGGDGSGGDGTTSADSAGENTGTGGTNSGSCPSLEPAVGSSCASEGEQCAFVNCVAPDYRDDHTLTCLNGAWALSAEVVCEEEADQCPASPPVRGRACDEATTPGPCTAVDACGSAQLAYCTNGVWVYEAPDGDADRIAPAAGGATVVGTAAPTGSATTGAVPEPELPECPLNPPVLGSPCCPSDYPALCDYASDGSAGSSGFDAPVPAAGGASSGDAATVQSATVVTTIGGTTTDAGTGGSGSGTATGSGGFAGSGSGGAGIAIECVTCSPDMVWAPSTDCL